MSADVVALFLLGTVALFFYQGSKKPVKVRASNGHREHNRKNWWVWEPTLGKRRQSVGRKKRK